MTGKIHLKLPYGKSFLKFSLPVDKLLGILENRKPVFKDVKTLVSESLEKPLSVDRLEDLISNKKKILVVVPDSTRSSHLKEILPYLFKRIQNKSRKIDIIVATGLHKKHDRRQLKRLLGDSILKRHTVTNHEHCERSLMNLGATASGIPVVLNRGLKKYDFIISIGVIEPHLYAGYSGGAKTIAIGLAGEETINTTHNVRFLDNPLTKIGSIRDNPFQNALWEIAAKAPSAGFSVNVVNDPDGRAIKIFAGSLRRVFENGVSYAASVFEVRVKKQSDIVICGIGYPKDVNLYQASRAVNYILNDKPIIKKRGVLIVAAELKDGPGDGVSEIRFYEKFRSMRSPKEFVEKIRQKGCVAGEHRAYMVAKPLLDYNIVFVSKGSREIMDGTPLKSFNDIDAALEYADGITSGSSNIYVIPRALSTIARQEV